MEKRIFSPFLSVVLLFLAVIAIFLAAAVIFQFEPVITPLRRIFTVRQATGWSVKLGDPVIVSNPARVPVYSWFPDGHISLLQNSNGDWTMYWAEYQSYRTLGDSPFPEDQRSMEPPYSVLGGRGGKGWDNGGTWLMSVFRTSPSELIGFAHAEDHWDPPNPEGIAWKSIAVTYSSDDGSSWSPAQPIITTWQTRPSSPSWGGAGDHSVVWDGEAQRWVCFYQEQAENTEAEIHVAVSTDPLGKPGSWLKWDGKDFTQPGLGGKGKPLPAFWGHEGGNPSVHWNTYLHAWIMVYGGWDGNLYISSSPDLLAWSAPQVLVAPVQNGRAWYPTILSDEGDTRAGQSARLYYADFNTDLTTRKFTMRTITFLRK